MNCLSRIMASAVLILCAPVAAIAAGTDDTRPAEFKNADSELNSVYRKLMKELRPPDREKLKASQLIWLKLRDADCKWAFPAEPLDCMIDRTSNRTRELQGTLFEAVDGKYREVSK